MYFYVKLVDVLPSGTGETPSWLVGKFNVGLVNLLLVRFVRFLFNHKTLLVELLELVWR